MAGLIALVSIIILPMLTVAFRDAVPIVDTWVMPATEMTLLDTAAILGPPAVVLRRERSVLSIVTLIATGLAGSFLTAILVSSAILGV